MQTDRDGVRPLQLGRRSADALRGGRGAAGQGHPDVFWDAFGRGVTDESVRSLVPAVAVRRAQSFSFSHKGLLILWGHLFAGSDVTHANLALINQCSSDTSYTGADRPGNIHIYVSPCVCVSVRKNDLLRTQTRKRRSCTGHSCHSQGLIRGLASGLTQRLDQEKVKCAKLGLSISSLQSPQLFITGVIAKEKQIHTPGIK